MRSPWCLALLARGGWPAAPTAVTPLALAEEENQGLPESPDAALKDLRPGPAAELVEQELQEEGDGAPDPRTDNVREQVQVRLNAVYSAMAQLKNVISSTSERAEKMKAESDRVHKEMNRASMETAKQLKMYSAGAQNENRLHEFDVSLMQNLDQARGMEAELASAQRAHRARMRNETEDKELTMGMILDWMNQKNGTENDAGEPIEGTFAYTNLEFELLKDRSVRMTGGVNANARELSDIIERTRMLEKEATKAQEVLHVIQGYFTREAMAETVKKDMEEEKTEQQGNAESLLQTSANVTKALLQTSANVTEVAPPAPSSAASLLESWLPVLPEARWPGDGTGASVGAYSVEGAV